MPGKEVDASAYALAHFVYILSCVSFISRGDVLASCSIFGDAFSLSLTAHWTRIRSAVTSSYAVFPTESRIRDRHQSKLCHRPAASRPATQGQAGQQEGPEEGTQTGQAWGRDEGGGSDLSEEMRGGPRGGI